MAGTDPRKEKVVPSVSFQSFSYSKGDSKQSKGRQVAVATVDEGEVSSVQKIERTKSTTAYTGMY